MIQSCTKESKSDSEFFTDIRDGQSYKTIKIGEQIWFAENLNYEYYNCWCYDDNKENCKKYGLLYTWWSAEKHVPRGWRLPTEKDWDRLIDFFGGKDSVYIKFILNQYEPFKINFAGMRYSDGKYSGEGKFTAFWTANEDNKNYGWVKFAKKDVYEFTRGSAYKWEGFSVRCVKDLK
jgi:uncharacterized protein (TIGR02145 family)